MLTDHHILLLGSPGAGKSMLARWLTTILPAMPLAAAIATPLPPEPWPPPLIKAGRRGPFLADCAGVRVVAVRDRGPGPHVWLVVRRQPATGALNTERATAPVNTPGAIVARISGLRGPIAPCGEAVKPLLGLGASAVRRGTGWPQQLTWVMLAHCCVARPMLTMQQQPRP